MPYQRPIFATLSLTYCLCLGVFALANNRRATLNRSFAFYNFSNALYNMADFVFLFPNHTAGLWWDRLAGVGGCLMFPYLMSFVFEIIGISNEKNFRTILRVNFVIAFAFIGLLATPYMVRDVNYTYLQSPLNTEEPGILYPLWAIWSLTTLGTLLVALPRALRAPSDLQRKRARYVALACFLGFIALAVYITSLFSVDLPSVYYSLQSLVAFTFAYAIFKHNLISVHVALRRASVLVGIYVGIGLMLIPVMFLYRHGIGSTSPLGAQVLLLLTIGLLFSMGPIVYGYMVKHSALLQDASTSHFVHELKAPLAAIQGAKAVLDSELAMEKPDAEKVRDYMSMIQRNTERLEKYVMEILDTTKVGDSRDIAKEPLDLAVLCTEVARQFPTLNGRITIDTPANSTAQANREGLRHVLTNLYSNAMKFCPEGPINVRIARLPDGVEVTVRDHGVGIPREDLKRIFKPFVQAAAGMKSAKGTGLGLAIAKRWIEAHNGEIWAESDGPGKGARFVFFLPF